MTNVMVGGRVVSVPKRRRRSKSTVDTELSTLLSPYTRVSTREQAESRAGLDSQKSCITNHAALHSLRLGEWRVDEGVSGKDLDRAQFQLALADVREGRTGGIIVAKLDRLSRSVRDFVALLEEAERDGWNIVALDLGVDLRSPVGRLVAKILAAVAEWEREVIGERTRDGLAAKAAAGVELGRPRTVSDELLRRVAEVYHQAGGFAPAARALQAAQVPTVTGRGRWHPGTVHSLLSSQAAVVLGVSCWPS